MLGWMDDEALRRTLSEGRVTFWSRSRGEYWRKGDTRGHVQHVRSVRPRLRRRRPAGAGRPGGRRLPHRRPHLLRRRRPRRAGGEVAGEPDVDARTCVRRDLARPRDLPAPGQGPPGHPGRPPAAWPTPRRRSASTASSPRTRPGTFLLESAEHGGVWSRYSIVGAAQPRDADRARRRRRTGSASRRSACPPTATRSRRCATPWPRCATEPHRGPAAAHRRHGRRHHLRRRAALGAGARRRRPTSSACPRSR